MKINKKALGANVRRGVLTGTVAGFFAGWLAFAGHAKQFAAAEYEAQQDVSKTAADLILPPVPALPAMPKLPSNPSYRIATGPNVGFPQLNVPRSIQAGTAPTVTTPNAPAANNAPSPVNNAPAPVNNAPAPVNNPPAATQAPYVPPPAPPPPAATPAPTFAPLPTLAPPPPKPAPKPTTAPSAPWP